MPRIVCYFITFAGVILEDWCLKKKKKLLSKHSSELTNIHILFWLKYLSPESNHFSFSLFVLGWEVVQ